MPILEAIILGIVQGLTEFLPVSSTAHLALTPWLVTRLGLANWSDPGLTFDVALHAGTLFAILLYFWRTWIQIIRAALGGKVVRFSETSDDQRDLTPEEQHRERQLLWYMIAATIPAALAGALLEKHIETTFRAPALVASMLIIVAVIMWIAERMSKFQKPLPQITLGDAMTVGVLQAFAVVPGVSRSGITITGGLFRNFTREAAARFSFLLSTPIIGGAALFKLHHVMKHGLPPGEMAPGMAAFAAGIVVSALVGYVTIAFFLRYLQTKTLTVFIVYRILFGIAVLLLGYLGHYSG
ncbi:MAG: undecaprenyl-diphosphate phosphatase [Candidatus Korobacteraceae bacterium]